MAANDSALPLFERSKKYKPIDMLNIIIVASWIFGFATGFGAAGLYFLRKRKQR